MEIASVIGIHGAMLGAPILIAELDARKPKEHDAIRDPSRNR